jgi:competence protein ComEA
MPTRKYSLLALVLAIALIVGLAGGAIAQAKGKVSLNKASAAQLAKVQGVTPALAKAIVDYRTKNGSFKKAEDLLKVPGITQDILKKMSVQADAKGDLTAPVKGEGEEEDEPSLKPSKC